MKGPIEWWALSRFQCTTCMKKEWRGKSFPIRQVLTQTHFLNQVSFTILKKVIVLQSIHLALWTWKNQIIKHKTEIVKITLGPGSLGLLGLGLLPLSETSTVFNQVWFCLPKHIFGCHNWGKACYGTGIWYVEARDADVRSRLHKTASTMKNYLAPNVDCTKAEKPWEM